MANEITITSKLNASKGGVTVTNATTTKTQTMSTTAEDMEHGTQNVGTAREALNVGDVDITNATGDQYIVHLRNMDDTNFCTVEVQTGASTYAEHSILLPGEFSGAIRRNKLDGSGYNGLFLKFDTAAGQVERIVVEAGDPAA